LEKNPDARDALASVFRTIHTIKGTCGFLGFDKLEAVAHVGENLLSRLRDRQLTLTPEITTALLSMVDAVRQMLSQIERAGQEGKRDDSVLIATLTRLQQAPAMPAKSEVAPLPASAFEVAEAPLNIGDIHFHQWNPVFVAAVGSEQLANRFHQLPASTGKHVPSLAPR
jgi:two-component system chemotaxis sensor kinase CheA